MTETKPEDWLTWTLYRPGKDGPDVELKTGVRMRSAETGPAELACEKLREYAADQRDWYVNVYGLGEDGPGVLAWADWFGEDGAVRSSATGTAPAKAATLAAAAGTEED